MDKVGRLVAAVNLLFPSSNARGFYSRDVSEKPAEGEAAVSKWTLRALNPDGRYPTLIPSLDDVAGESHDDACSIFAQRLLKVADERVTKREDEREQLKKLLVNT